MRTSFDLPDTLFTEAKIKAAKEGISMKDLFTRAIQKELSAASSAPGGEPVWKQLYGTGKAPHAPDSSGFDTYYEPDWPSSFQVNEES
jgi:hypothetical protein